MVENLVSLKQIVEKEDFWEQKDTATVLKEAKQIESLIDSFNHMEGMFQSLLELYQSSPQAFEADKDLIEELKNFEKDLDKFVLESALNEKFDRGNAYVDFHSGAGGVEAQDWCEITIRMYSKWCQKQNYKVTIEEMSKGEEVGIKSATLKIEGLYAYGWLKLESGIHRFVRLSPFDSSNRRHTSFVSVHVYPEPEENLDIEILDKDLRIDTYRASGAGGQHVNTTDSAVRITHMPSGLVVQSQSNRSQHKNKAEAMKMLKSKLFEKQQQQQEQEKNKQENTKADMGFGSQIRSYILHPYKMVKDLRTGYEDFSPKHVLDGDIYIFMQKMLEYIKTGKKDTNGQKGR